jgi:hypothetical protein
VELRLEDLARLQQLVVLLLRNGLKLFWRYRLAIAGIDERQPLGVSLDLDVVLLG